MKKNFILLFILASLYMPKVATGSSCPIIFIHGHEGEDPRCEIGWESWDNSNSAMRKILNSKYGGYTAGNPLKCSKDTGLSSTNGETRKIYNFSYYNPDGSRGAIGSNGNLWPDPPDQEYNNNVNHAQWAKHLADFIAKVLNACYGPNWQSNPNAEVDIVAHSMGGLVAKATGSRRSREVYLREPRSPEVTEDGWGFRQLKGLTAKQNFL